MKVKQLLTFSLVLISPLSLILLLHSTTIWKGITMQASPSSHTNEEKHVLANMEKCWKAIDLTEYLMETGYRDTARHRAIHMMRTIKTFVLGAFDNKSRNHCWNMNITTIFNNSFNGQIGLYNFEANPNTLHPHFVYKAQKKFSSFSSSSVCLPEAFLAGFPKCGSTLLYNLLLSHPSVIEPVYKEPHWWVSGSSFWPVDSKLIPALLAAYLHNFGPLVVGGNSRTPLTIDATPSIMFDMPGFDLKTKIVDVCVLPALIPVILPKSKFIVVMRDPVDMMYSAFWHSCTRNGGSVPMETQLKCPDIFHERVVHKIHSFNSCIRRFPLPKCVMDANPEVSEKLLRTCGRTRVDIAVYYIHVKKWLSVVPHEKFLFLTVEELYSKLDVVMGQIWKFLDIPPFQGYHSALSDPRVVNQQHIVDYRHNPRLQMRNDTREILQQFFHPFNQKLADLLGDEKFLW